MKSFVSDIRSPSYGVIRWTVCCKSCPRILDSRLIQFHQNNIFNPEVGDLLHDVTWVMPPVLYDIRIAGYVGSHVPLHKVLCALITDIKYQPDACTAHNKSVKVEIVVIIAHYFLLWNKMFGTQWIKKQIYLLIYPSLLQIQVILALSTNCLSKPLCQELVQLILSSQILKN